MCFDMTASNKGFKNEACVQLEHNMKKKMLWFRCRPHILEILLEAAVASTFQPSSGPSIDIFKRFKSKWNAIDKNKFDLLEYFPHQEKENLLLMHQNN